MDRFFVTLPGGEQVPAKPGEKLLEVLRAAGLAVDAPCGGNGSCGKCRVLVDGQEALACATKIHRDMTVALPEKKDLRILTAGEARSLAPDATDRYALAFDIGTTTLVCFLLDGHTGQLLARAGALNPQASFGADVISRLQHVKESGSEELTELVRKALAQLTLEAARQAGIDPMQITRASVVGNTAMHHLFLGIDPGPLTVPPYMPSVSQAMEVSAGGILPIAPEGSIRVLPNIAGFVGADTVGCLAATRFDQLEDLTLMIDIGTNGELVLGNKHRRIACSTAAGPAFEGAKIRCGMRGEPGAVDHVTVRNGQLQLHTIADAPIRGICGSGLLDLVAALLDTGVIAPSGRIAQKEYMLAQPDIVLTQKDVREVQLAKSAIRAGIELLCKTLCVQVADIKQVLLAGAFGSYMDPASACRIGMIPPVLENKIISIGNAAGEGAKLCAVSRAEFDRSKDLAAGTEFLELASCPEFQDCYIGHLGFEEEK